MAPNEEPDASKAKVSFDHSSSAVESETPARPDSSSQQPSGQQKTENTSAFSHPGARIIAQQAADGDGPYRCRKCGHAVLTVSTTTCIACLDQNPWFPFPSADDEEPV